LVLGLEAPQAGTISLLGENPKKSRSLVGYVPQHTSYDSNFPISVLEVVRMGCVDATKRGGKAKQTEKALKALRQVELEHLAERPYNALSGGQRRRVLVARALSAEPIMLILDEPAANLDKESEQRLYATLSKLKGSTTILIVTHDMREVSPLIDRVFCIDAHKDGKIGRTVVQHALEDEAEGTRKRVRHDVEIPGDFCHYPREENV
jgi:zinc transport system ATP-binding protein